MRILHVTESLGGGVTTAINSYVSNSRQFKHFLLASARDSDCTGEENFSGFENIKLVPRKLVSLFFLKSLVKEVEPDIIHVHSSYAGLIFRVLFNKKVIPVVYTPHGFSFLRDDHWLAKKIYYFVENILSYRTSVVAGCSKNEADIALHFSSGVKVHELVNVCESIDVIVKSTRRDDCLTVGMVGRIAKQKDYFFFAELAQKMGKICRFKWIGGGDERSVNVLEAAGVEVTGWIPRKEVLEHLVSLDVYFHSAAWDGFPMSVLEAVELGRPVVLREIGPFTAEGLNTVRGIDEAYKEISSLVAGDEDAWQRAKLNTEKIRGYHTQENLSKALHDLYSQFSK
tara:strand:- start:178 stop:1200 length:1023 start_codon:yes stop_codon:yes gene_type:complete